MTPKIDDQYLLGFWHGLEVDKCVKEIQAGRAPDVAVLALVERISGSAMTATGTISDGGELAVVLPLPTTPRRPSGRHRRLSQTPIVTSLGG